MMHVMLLLALLSPVWTFQAGINDNNVRLLPMPSAVDVGDTFTLHITTDWAIGETAPMTITLDPHVEWLAIAGGAFCEASTSKIVCPEPSYEWITVHVREGGNDTLEFIAEYEGDQKVITVPVTRHHYLPIVQHP